MFRLPSRRNTANNTNGGGSRDTSRTSIDTVQTTNTPSPPPLNEHDMLHDSEYADRCRRIMQLYHALRELGAERFLEDNLPKIVVIGGQSAGKSSLVEAVSKITVPRDSGTCTRCPMECTMSSGATSWSCTISLRIEFSQNGSEINPTSTHFVTLTAGQEHKVEIYLRRAQAAILSSSNDRPIASFLPMTKEQLTQLTGQAGVLPFSRNTICVSVKAPNMTDLAFVDLPGLIHNAADEEIETVKGLVQSKIRSDKTIVLVTIPASSDMQGEDAVKLAKEADTDGRRTIGVLTKPDILSAGATGQRQTWKRVLLGEDYPLHHGYFCVRLPDDEQRRTGENIDAISKRFFDSTAPWSEVPDRSRFGVKGLVDYMSRLLVKMVDENVPEMKAQVALLIASHQTSLDALGPPPTISYAAFLGRILTFSEDLRKAISGDAHREMVQGNRASWKHLTEEILKTCPSFIPFDSHSEYRNPHVKDDTWTGPDDPSILTKQSTYVMDVLDVRNAINQNITWELPGEVPLSTTRELIAAFTSKWSEPTLQCFSDIFTHGQQSVLKLLGNHFGQFEALEGHLRSIILRQMEVYREDARAGLMKIIAVENINGIVYNGAPGFIQERDRWIQRFLNVRGHHSNFYLHPSECHYSLRLVPEEIELMGKVRAYFEVAYKRFVDVVALTMENELHQPLVERLYKAVIEGTDSARIDDLMKESASVVQERKYLKEKLGRLRQIAEQLESV